MRWMLATLSFLFGVLSAYADRPAPPRVLGASSPSGRFVVRVIPDFPSTGRRAVAQVYEFTESARRYDKKREFQLVNEVSPQVVCILETGELFTFDDWPMRGFDHVVVSYSADGAVRFDRRLDEVFSPTACDTLQKEHRSVSNVWWLSGDPYVRGDRVIAPCALGGSLRVGATTVEYDDPEEETEPIKTVDPTPGTAPRNSGGTSEG